MSRFLVTERQVAQRPAEEEAVSASERRLAEHLGAWALARQPNLRFTPRALPSGSARPGWIIGQVPSNGRLSSGLGMHIMRHPPVVPPSPDFSLP
jgi:hypothetical protein